MNPINFGGQRSNLKVTMGLYGNNLAYTIETELLCVLLSNWSDMLTMVRGWTLLILEVKGQGHWQMLGVGDATLCVVLIGSYNMFYV